MIITEKEYLFNNYGPTIYAGMIIEYNKTKKDFRNDRRIKHILGKTYSAEELSQFSEMAPGQVEEALLKKLQALKRKTFYNRCPKCDNLARTPKARQCPTCNYSWYHCPRGTFLVKSMEVFYDRDLVVMQGHLQSGVLEAGMRLSFMEHDLGIFPKVLEVHHFQGFSSMVVELVAEPDRAAFLGVGFVNRVLELDGRYLGGD